MQGSRSKRGCTLDLDLDLNLLDTSKQWDGAASSAPTGGYRDLRRLPCASQFFESWGKVAGVSSEHETEIGSTSLCSRFFII
jgi:hypothetical protein